MCIVYTNVKLQSEIRSERNERFFYFKDKLLDIKASNNNNYVSVDGFIYFSCICNALICSV